MKGTYMIWIEFGTSKLTNSRIKLLTGYLIGSKNTRDYPAGGCYNIEGSTL